MQVKIDKNKTRKKSVVNETEIFSNYLILIK